MSETNSPTAQQSAKKRPNVRFTLEVGDDFGRNILIVSLKQEPLPLRGEFRIFRFQMRAAAEGRALPGKPPFIGGIGSVPPVPGMRLEVDVARGTVRVFDPLSLDENAKLLATLERLLQRGLRIGSESKLGASAERTHSLNDDEMRTLLLDLCHLVEEGSATVVKGSLPSESEVQDIMPGRTLYDPRSSRVKKPKYVDELDVWERGMQRAAAMIGE